MTEFRPIVARKGKDRTPFLFAIAMVAAAILLFALLNGRRQALQNAGGEPGALEAPNARPEAIPDLVLPAPVNAPQTLTVLQPQASVPVQPDPGQYAVPSPQVVVQRLPAPGPSFTPSPAPPAAPYPITEPGSPSTSPISVSPSETARGTTAQTFGRIAASRLANPSDTVPQGTIIGAVLETALDSTGAGQARALVTRNVFGFDGKKLLVPRGSRLYGVYQAGAEQGQKRALVRWTRLIRPDGVTIGLDSAASDPLGRTGIKGKVNSHFWERFGNALLSSTVGFGDAFLSRRVPSVVVAVPGAQPGNQAVSQISQQSGQVRPTLEVKPGARVSVFVEHDLDFSTVEDAS